MRFGAQLKPHPPAEQFDLVRRLETLGFDGVFTGDHVSFHNPLYESLTLLASYAAITQRIKLGVAVYLLALRTPAVAAKITATVDVLSGGRLVFGVGVGGENPKEFELCGVPHGERGARVSEGIDAVRTLWRDTPATFKGRFTQFEGVSIDPKPLQALPPIWVGGRSDAALARAGRQGDGWVSYVVQPERYAQSLDKVRAAAEAAGRALDGFTPAHLGFITVGRDYESARDTWVRLLTKRYAQDFAPLAGKYGIIGTPAQCAEQIEKFRAAGCRFMIADAICEPAREREQLEMIAADVIPRFR
ncbi:MAG: LLM class flavin-dependent oxidoreductase [Candidatus Rokuibacteriota bacterium]